MAIAEGFVSTGNDAESSITACETGGNTRWEL